MIEGEELAETRGFEPLVPVRGHAHAIVRLPSFSTTTAAELPDESGSLLRVLGYTLKTVISYSLKDLAFGGSMDDITPERMVFMQRLTAAGRWERCPRCPEEGAADCKSPGHRQLGFSGHVLSMLRRRTKRVEVAPGVVETVVLRPGRSFANLTRRRLREERRAWIDADFPAGVGSGLDASQVQLMEWWNERHAPYVPA